MMKMTGASAQQDPRVQRMIANPTAYFKAARQEARKEAKEAIRREGELRRRSGKR